MSTETQERINRAERDLTRTDVESLLRKVGSTDKLDLSNQNLMNIDLSDFDLRGANLHGANLQGVQFKKTMLVSARPNGDVQDWAKINRVNLSNISLSKADLGHANLSGVDLSEANLNGADLSNAALIRATLRWAISSGVNLSHADLREADLGWADLRLADLSGANLSKADLSNANLSGANLSKADLSNANLSGANLSKADLSNADLSRVTLIRTNLSGANLHGTIFYGTNLGRIKLLWAKLKGANLSSIDPSTREDKAYGSGEENALPHNRIARNDVKDITSSNTTTSNFSRSGGAGQICALIIALHPRRWTKSLLVFAGFVFAQRLYTLSSVVRVLLTFVIFCLASSCIYLLNDFLDLKKDQEHPVKRNRPLASGTLPISLAIVTMVMLIFLCTLLTFLIFTIPINPLPDPLAFVGGANVLFVLVTSSFLLLTVMYNIHLKHIVLLDVFTTTGSAVLRILAGAIVISVSISPWLYLLTILLELFFGLGKRRHELSLLQEHSSRQRQVLKEYSIPLLDQMITILVAAVIMVYSLYTLQGVAGNQLLMVTIPLVLYGMFRYLYLIYMRKESNIPEELLLRDRHLLISFALCAAIIIIAHYTFL